MAQTGDTHSKTIGYLLWIFGFTGSHRFYYGKPISGTIWFFTLGLLGIVLGGALFACLIWWLIDIEVLSLDSPSELTWIILLVLSLILAAGMSWSHIRRRLTGPGDVDDHDN